MSPPPPKLLSSHGCGKRRNDPPPPSSFGPLKVQGEKWMHVFMWVSVVCAGKKKKRRGKRRKWAHFPWMRLFMVITPDGGRWKRSNYWAPLKLFVRGIVKVAEVFFFELSAPIDLWIPTREKQKLRVEIHGRNGWGSFLSFLHIQTPSLCTVTFRRTKKKEIEIAKSFINVPTFCNHLQTLMLNWFCAFERAKLWKYWCMILKSAMPRRISLLLTQPQKTDRGFTLGKRNKRNTKEDDPKQTDDFFFISFPLIPTPLAKPKKKKKRQKFCEMDAAAKRRRKEEKTNLWSVELRRC